MQKLGDFRVRGYFNFFNPTIQYEIHNFFVRINNYEENLYNSCF